MAAIRHQVPYKVARGSGTRCLAPPRASVQRNRATADHPTLRDRLLYLPGNEGWRCGRTPANQRPTLAGESGLDEVSDSRSAHRRRLRTHAESFGGMRSEPVGVATRPGADFREVRHP